MIREILIWACLSFGIMNAVTAAYFESGKAMVATVVCLFAVIALDRNRS